MSIAVERIEDNQVVLSFTASKEEVAKAHEDAYKKIVSKVKINGFRQGKAPRHIVERQIGKEAITQEAFDIFANKAYTDALKANELHPISDPEIMDMDFAEGKDASFKIKVTVKPEAVLGEYKGIVMKKDEAKLEEGAVDKAIAELQKSHSTMEVVAEGAEAQKSDVVMIDFAGSIDGVPFDGGEGKSYPLELGSNSFIPGFEDQLVGVKAGEERIVKVQFPAEYGVEALAGKDAEFKVNVHEIKRRQTPELNDEFAKTVNFDSVEALKEGTAKKLQDAATEQAENKYREEIIKKVVDEAQVEIPKILIDEKVDNMVAEMAFSIEQRGLKIEQYLQFMGQTMDEFKASRREAAEEQVKTELVLDTVCKLENIELTNEELGAEIVRLAQMHGATPKQVQDVLKEQGTFGVLIGNILRRKAASLIIDSAKAE